jgi:hypothetical protein
VITATQPTVWGWRWRIAFVEHPAIKPDPIARYWLRRRGVTKKQRRSRVFHPPILFYRPSP